MKEEIAAGLKNALERGASLDSAAQSFINAGYSPAEVKAAAQSISDGATALVSSGPAQQHELSSNLTSSSQKESPNVPSPIVKPDPASLSSLSSVKSQSYSKTGTIVALGIILVVLLAGIIGLVLFRDTIIDLLKGILG